MSSQTRIQAARRAVRWGVVLIMVLAWATPAAHAQRGKKDNSQEQGKNDPIFYPDPPDEPRIQFLRSYNSEEDSQVKRGRFRRFIVGADESKARISLGKPYGVAIHDGQIFVCDIQQKVVIIIDLKTGAFSAMGQGDTGRLAIPVNIAIDADGTSYIADRGLGRVMVYSSEGQYLTAYGADAEMAPTDVAIYEDGLYVCDIDQDQVIVLDKRTGKELRRIGGQGPAEGKLFMPTNVDIDLDGNVFVTDTGNTCVLRFNSRGGYVRQIGTRGDSPGQFFRPKGIAVDRERRLYAVDAGWENVQIFDYDGQLLLYFASPGNAPGNLTLPAAIAVDYDNVQYFEDRVAPGYEIEYLILVSSQYGGNKINVYGFLKKNE